ncbi:hypothetical protein BESB_085000 [Besnoitia besnoiti]|uniref:RAP domain-containing protein n=1 Tax=Besnoitia besnoiti TaxID=94643 RepID=A0A2A9MAG3_BESBE|nr:hypothetical protein BESB_085000 [Besnoitia besnoiti]PFH33301.1 hypothetical protein BESB_085000 [Besnoitia besnoiti]
MAAPLPRRLQGLARPLHGRGARPSVSTPAATPQSVLFASLFGEPFSASAAALASSLRVSLSFAVESLLFSSCSSPLPSRESPSSRAARARRVSCQSLSLLRVSSTLRASPVAVPLRCASGSLRNALGSAMCVRIAASSPPGSLDFRLARRPLFSQRSAGLKIPRLARVYEMEPRELRDAVADCARRQIRMKELWDAFLYRAVVLRSELRPEYIATIFRSLAMVQKPVLSFVDYILEDVRFRLDTFRLQDVALLLSSLARLQVQDDLLLQAFVPVILKRISSTTPPKDLALLFHAFVRMHGPQTDLVASRVVASLAGRTETLHQPQTLALLLYAFSEHARRLMKREAMAREATARLRQEPSEGEGASEAAAALEACRARDADGKAAKRGPVDAQPSEGGGRAEEAEDAAGEEGGEREEGEDGALRIPFHVFLEILLEQVGRELRDFRARDCVHAVAAVANLAACNKLILRDAVERRESAEAAQRGRASATPDAPRGVETPENEGEEAKWNGSWLPPSLLEDVLWRAHKRLMEVKFEMQSREAVLLFRSIHNLQTDCAGFVTEAEELLKDPSRAHDSFFSSIGGGLKPEAEKKKRRRPLLERLRTLVSQEIVHRAGTLETSDVLELLRILAAEDNRVEPALEAALCVRLGDSLVAFSSPYFKPQVELHKTLQQSADAFLRLFAPAAQPYMPPSAAVASLASSPSAETGFGGGAHAATAVVNNSAFASASDTLQSACEHRGRPYRFAQPLGVCFFKLLAKQRELKLTPQVAASVTWALGVLRVRDPHWASTLKHRRASVVSCTTGQTFFPSSDCAAASRALASEAPVASGVDCSDAAASDDEDEAALSRQRKDYFQGVETVAKLTGGLALLGMSDVADELGLFPLLSTVECFRDAEVALSVLTAATVFDLTRRPATLANSLLLPAAEAVYDQRSSLSASLYPALRFVAMSSVLSACSPHLQEFFANPGGAHFTGPSSGGSSASRASCVAPHLSRVSSHDMLLCSQQIQKRKHRWRRGRGPQALAHGQQLDAIVSRYLNTQKVGSLVYKPTPLVADALEEEDDDGELFGDPEEGDGASEADRSDAAADADNVGAADEDDEVLTFPERVRKELASWHGVQVACEVPVGPFLVPFAVDLVSLGNHLKRFPLTPAKSLCNVGEDQVDAGEAEGDGEANEREVERFDAEEGDAAEEKGWATPSARVRDGGVDVEADEVSHASQCQGEDELDANGEESEEGDGEAAGCAGASEEGPERRTHVLIDLLWRDFDFYLDAASDAAHTAPPGHRAGRPISAVPAAGDDRQGPETKEEISESRETAAPVASQRSAAGRVKSPLLCAGKFAELNALRRQGWHVVCVSETSWIALEAKRRKGDGDRDALKRYILSCIASLGKGKRRPPAKSDAHVA